MEVIRTEYLDELDTYRDADLIKVLSGIRRCGKSTIFKQYAERLIDGGVKPEQVLSYNFDSPLDLKKLGKTWEEIFFSIYNSLDKNTEYFIFLDEVQEVEEFERLILGLYIEKNINVFVTGSNAYLMSSELATLLTGRTIEISVFPFSFKEFKSATSNSENENLLTAHYLQESSLPQAVSLRSQGIDKVLNYVDGVVNTIVERDVYPNIHNVNKRVFENVYKYVLKNIGSEVSPSSISKALKQDRVDVSHITVAHYLDLMCASFLLYKVHRFDVKGKRQLATREKYYVPDVGIRHLLIGQKNLSDRGHLLENIVYFELLRRGGRVWIGKVDDKEVDFIVKKNTGEIEYYQVTYDLSDPVTYKRELASLKAIKDHYPKTVLSVEPFEGADEGIKFTNVSTWLLEGE